MKSPVSAFADIGGLMGFVEVVLEGVSVVKAFLAWFRPFRGTLELAGSSWVCAGNV